MKTSASELSKIPRFHLLPAPTLERVTRLATAKPFGPGARLVEQGDFPSAFFLIQAGYLKWERAVVATTVTLLDVLGPCETPGELALRHLGQYPASAIALTHGTLLALPRDFYQELLAAEPRFAQKTSYCMGERAYSLFGRVESGAMPDVKHRLGSFLYRLCLKFGQQSPDGSYEIPFSLARRDLAFAANCQRETASRILSLWSKEEKVQSSFRSIRVSRIFLAELREILGENGGYFGSECTRCRTKA